MKFTSKRSFLFALLILPLFVLGQTDTASIKKDSLTKTSVSDSLTKTKDSTMQQKDSATGSVNCYKDWLEAFGSRGARSVTDGMQEVVIAFKSEKNYHCFMRRVQVVGRKIKAPLYVKTESGDYKTFGSIGKKLDPDFASAHGDALWKITDGMSVLFKTTDNEYGRIFFYKFVSKGSQVNKKALSPDQLIKD